MLAIAGLAIADWWSAAPPEVAKSYVGRQTCARCHQEEVQQWTGSDHDRALDLATPQTVLGDFDDATFTHQGSTSRLRRRGDAYFIEAEDRDGRRREFPVRYVIGVRPLQQYIVEMEGGRLQVAPASWDVEKKRWFHIAPQEVASPGDLMHWTGSAWNFNHMCVSCHTTDYHKGFDPQTGHYHATFAEIDVSCESCHGPGSLHVDLAENKWLFWDRNHGYGLAKLKGKDNRPQIDACAACHAHRTEMYPGFHGDAALLDHFAPSLLHPHLYHADGQIQEEVYEYGSFLQSLMYRKGVRCSDCHNPHSARLKFEGNKLCGQCHTPAKYDTPAHHHHRPDTPSAQCVNCHMPGKNFMQIDFRRDHSFRVPRPDLTEKLGVPNACNTCHTKPQESAAWAAQFIVQWFGPQRRQNPHYAEVFHAAWQQQSGAAAGLLRLLRSDEGPMVRATAVELLASHLNQSAAREAVEAALADDEPLLRMAAVRALEGLPGDERTLARDLVSLLSPRLRDPRRVVRAEAARLLAPLPPGSMDTDDRRAFQSALEEYEASLRYHADRPEARLSLGILFEQRGRSEDAAEAYRAAIALEEQLPGPRMHLANLLAREGGSPEEVRRLRQAEADILRREVRLLPEQAQLQFQLGVLSLQLDDAPAAEQAFREACRLAPRRVDYWQILTEFYIKHRRWRDALEAAEQLRGLRPDDPSVGLLLDELRRQQAAPAEPAPAPPPP